MNSSRFAVVFAALTALLLVQGNGTFAQTTAPAFISGRDVVSGAQIQFEAPSDRKPLVVVFLSARCPCSAGHEEALKDLVRAYPGTRFIGVHANVDETPEQTRDHFSQAALPFSVIQDEGSRLADRWGAFKTPHAFVFGSDGELLFQGGVDDSKQSKTARVHHLADALSALSSGKKPSHREARTLGCVIKR